MYIHVKIRFQYWHLGDEYMVCLYFNEALALYKRLIFKSVSQNFIVDMEKEIVILQTARINICVLNTKVFSFKFLLHFENM